MIEPNVLAFQNATLLEALGDREALGLKTSTDLATHIGKDPANTRRALKSLSSEKLIHADAFAEGLTADGVAQLAAFKRAKHGGETRRAKGRWPLDKFRRNPDNRTVDRDHVEAIADTASEEGVGDILLPVVAGPSDAHGVRMILAGEHRWEAAKLLAEQDRLPPALGQGLPFIERDVDAGEVAIIACIENTARKDQSPWEDAKQLRVAADALKLTAPELGRRTGRTREGSRGGLRDIQSKLKVAREATDEAIAAYEADPAAPGAWETLRESVSKPKPREPGYDDLPITKAHKLALVELFHKAKCTVGLQVPVLSAAFTSGGERLAQYELIKLERSDTADAAMITGKGADALKHWGFGQSLLGIGADRQALGVSRAWEPGFQTTWLNTPHKAHFVTPMSEVPALGGVEAITATDATAGDDIPALVIDAAKAMPDFACDDPWISMPRLELNLDASRQISVKLFASPDGLQHVATLAFRWAGGGLGENARVDERNPACASRFLALQQARMRLVGYGAPEWALTWFDQQMGLHVVGGVAYYNAVRAGEARRNLGIEKRQANYGGGSSGAPKTYEHVADEPVTEAAVQDALETLRADEAISPAVREALPSLALIRIERLRQTETEGWSPEHDDEQNPDGQLANAAAAYAAASVGDPDAALFWPGEWDPHMFNPTGGMRDLIRAGALIIAEIERRQRIGDTA